MCRRLSIIRTKAAWGALYDLARETPHYQDRHGYPDMGHVMGGALALGFIEIADDNVTAVVAALRAHAAEKDWQQTAANENLADAAA